MKLVRIFLLVYKYKKQTDSKKGRIIIRNIVYDISEKHLRGLLSKYGEILDV